MSKIIKKENYRIIVEPTGTGINLQKYKNIIHQINRHVDDIEDVRLKWDAIEICSFCESRWETREGEDEPLCCEEAQKEWKKTKNMCKRVEAAAFANMAMGLLGYKS